MEVPFDLSTGYFSRFISSFFLTASSTEMFKSLHRYVNSIATSATSLSISERCCLAIDSISGSRAHRNISSNSDASTHNAKKDYELYETFPSLFLAERQAFLLKAFLISCYPLTKLEIYFYNANLNNPDQDALTDALVRQIMGCYQVGNRLFR